MNLDEYSRMDSTTSVDAVSSDNSLNTGSPKQSIFDRLNSVGGTELDVVHEPEGSWFSMPTFMSYCGSSWLVAIAFLDPGTCMLICILLPVT
jgi:hypothetical protein